MTKLERLLSEHCEEMILSPTQYLVRALKSDIILIMKEYAEFCCEQQKIICSIPRHCTNPNIVTRYYSEESILNSPTYKEEDGK